MATNDNNKNYLGAFLVMVFLFFIIGFLTTANTQFQAPLRTAFLSGAGDAKNTLATLITFSWFLAYPVFGKLKALTGKGPNDIIKAMRLNKAKELLLTHEYNVGEVADKVGFTEPKYFSVCFKKQFGVSPSEI